MRRKSERTKEKEKSSPEKKVEKAPRRSRRQSRRRKSSVSTSPDREESAGEENETSVRSSQEDTEEEQVVNFEEATSQVGAVITAEPANTTEGEEPNISVSTRTRRSTKKQQISESESVNPPASKPDSSHDSEWKEDNKFWEEPESKNETADSKHKEKDSRSPVWKVKSADGGKGGEIQKLKLCIVRPQETPEPSGRKKKRLSRGSNQPKEKSDAEEYESSKGSQGEDEKLSSDERSSSKPEPNEEKEEQLISNTGNIHEDGSPEEGIVQINISETETVEEEAKTAAESEVEHETETECEVVSKIEAEAEQESEPEVVPEVVPEAEQEVEPEAEQEVEPEAEQEVEPEVVQEVEPEVVPEVEPGVVLEVECEAEQEVKPEVIAEVEREVVQEVEPEVAQTVEPEVAQTVEPEVVQTVEPEGVQTVEPEGVQTVEPEVAQTVEPEVAQTVEPEVAQTVEPEVAQTVEPEVAQEVEPGVAQEVEPEVAQEVEPEVAQEVDPEVAQEVDPEVAQEVDPEVVQEVEPEVAQEAEPEVVQEVEPEEVQQETEPEAEQEVEVEGQVEQEPPEVERELEETEVGSKGKEAEESSLWEGGGNKEDEKEEKMRESPLASEGDIESSEIQTSPAKEEIHSTKTEREERHYDMNMQEAEKDCTESSLKPVDEVQITSSVTQVMESYINNDSMESDRDESSNKDTVEVDDHCLVKENVKDKKVETPKKSLPAEVENSAERDSKTARYDTSDDEKELPQNDDSKDSSPRFRERCAESQRSKEHKHSFEGQMKKEDLSGNRNRHHIELKSRSPRRREKVSLRRSFSGNSCEQEQRKDGDVLKIKREKMEISDKMMLENKENDSEKSEMGVNAGVTPGYPRKRRWGQSNSSRPSKKPVLSISTVSLKSLIPGAKPVPIGEVQLEKDEETRRDGEIWDNDKIIDREKIKSEVKDEVLHEKVPLMLPDASRISVAVTDDHQNKVVTRKISIVSDDARTLQRSPSPPRHKATNVLFITNLVRPFTVNQLKELLARTGKIVEGGFWIDKIKSKCYVEYEKDSEAKETRHALHGVRWPVSNPKTLCVDFGKKEDMEMAQAVAESDQIPRKTEPLKVERGLEWEVEQAREKERERDMREREKEKEKERERERVRGKERPHHVPPEVMDHNKKMSVREWDLGKIGQTSPAERDIKYDEKNREKDRKVRRDKPYRSRSVSPHDATARKVKKKEDDAPAKLLDDLFRKTKTTPCIYWLPLTAEQIVVKEEMRRKHMAEHERRMAEMRKAERERERARAQQRQQRRVNEREKRRRRSTSGSPKK